MLEVLFQIHKGIWEKATWKSVLSQTNVIMSLRVRFGWVVKSIFTWSHMAVLYGRWMGGMKFI